MPDSRPSCSIIIPTLNASSTIRQILQRLADQTVKPDDILLIDSSSTDDTLELAQSLAQELSLPVRTILVPRADFDHGGTRATAADACSTDILMYMTQDALPQNDYVEQVLSCFEDPEIGTSFGRQLARPEATAIERLVRDFNYPTESYIRSIEDVPRYGIKTFFSSDVCSAFRATVYHQVGGFRSPMLVSEDMFLVIDILNAGYKIMYNSEAIVTHSHDYTFSQQLKRNFNVGASLALNQDLICGASEVSEGARLFKQVTRELSAQHRYGTIISFYFDCAARLIGNRLGRKCATLPRRWVYSLSGNKSFWDKYYAAVDAE